MGKAEFTDGSVRDKLYFVLEHADIGSLCHVIENCGALNEKLARYYFSKLINAVEYIHSLGLVHLDIKPMNILIKSDDNFVKLADFGHALETKFSPSGKCNEVRGTF